MKGRSFALLTALLAGAALGQAASQVPLSIETLAAKADAVVHGTVVRMSCQRDDGGRIFTKVHLQIIEQMNGRQRGATLVIVQGGGVLGRRIARSPIQPTYRVGAEVIVFVVFNSRGEAVTLGLNQGKFDVARQPETSLAHGAESVPRLGQAGRPARGGEARAWPVKAADIGRVEAPGEEGGEVSRWLAIAASSWLGPCRHGIRPVQKRRRPAPALAAR